jgi:hypothetical protein
MLHLLLYDDFAGDWYLHAVFEDKEQSYETIERIISRGVGYQLIKGSVIRRRNPIEDYEN